MLANLLIGIANFVCVGLSFYLEKNKVAKWAFAIANLVAGIINLIVYFWGF